MCAMIQDYDEKKAGVLDFRGFERLYHNIISAKAVNSKILAIFIVFV